MDRQKQPILEQTQIVYGHHKQKIEKTCFHLGKRWETIGSVPCLSLKVSSPYNFFGGGGRGGGDSGQANSTFY